MELSPNLKSNLNSEMNDLVQQAEEWAQSQHRSASPGALKDPKLCAIYKMILQNSALLLIEKSGVKTVEEFQKVFGPIIEEQKNKEDEIIEFEEFEEIEKARAELASPTSFTKYSMMLDEPLSASPFNRRRTSLFSDLHVLSPIASASSESFEKPKRFASSTQHAKKSFVTVESTRTPWRRSNSMYLEDVLNRTINTLLPPTEVPQCFKTESFDTITSSWRNAIGESSE
eukprot:NP_499186.1 Uncharacterized protein CELE_K11H3.2 [Caenorhabditis elegans]